MNKKIKKQNKLIVLFLLAISLLVGCGKDTTGPADIKEQDKAIYTDDVGRKVELPDEIDRVVTLGSTGQIMMISLAPDMLLGINTPIERNAENYFSYDISSLPVIGQYYGQRTLNLEELANLEGDVIIDLGDTKPKSAEDMDEIQKHTGIPTIHINATLETSADAFRKLGELIGREERAEELATYCEMVYDRTKTMMDSIAEEDKVRLVSCVSPDGLMVTVKGSSHSEILDFVGINVAESVGNNGEISIEQLHIWNPDVILFIDTSIYELVDNMPEWSTLKAIETGKYPSTKPNPNND